MTPMRFSMALTLSSLMVFSSASVDSARHRITCSNETDTLSYGLKVAEGLDWEVSIYGEWEPCTAFLARGAEQ